MGQKNQQKHQKISKRLGVCTDTSRKEDSTEKDIRNERGNENKVQKTKHKVDRGCRRGNEKKEQFERNKYNDDRYIDRLDRDLSPYRVRKKQLIIELLIK